jgi:transcriptional regulator with XRE-family HTH domain
MTHQDTFEQFPIRPQPHPLESMDSYLTRLASANRVQIKHGFFAFCFQQVKSYASKSNNQGFLPDEFQHLAQVTNLSLQRLHEMTFYPIAQKMKQKTTRRSFGELLDGIIYPYWRYCPQCLHEKGYYSLLWSFKPLKGCVEHQCYLLDACGVCQQPVTISGILLDPVACPHCSARLDQCQVTTMSEEDQQLAWVRHKDYAFLLKTTPQSSLITLGRHLQQLRIQQGLSLGDVARMLNIRLGKLRAIEENAPHGFISFAFLQQYVDYLGLSMREVFGEDTHYPEIISQVTRRQQQIFLQQAHQREVELCHQAQPLLQAWLAQQRPISKNELALALKLETLAIDCYPDLHRLFLNAQKQQLAAEEDQLMQRAIAFVQHRLQTQQRIQKMEILQHIKIKQVRINRCFPRLKTYLDGVLEQQEQLDQQHIKEVLQQTRDILDQCLQQQRPIVLRRISQRLQIPTYSFRRYPQLREMIDDAHQQQQRLTQQKDQKLAEKIPKLTQQLIEQQKPLYIKTFVQRLNISDRQLTQYPLTNRAIRQSIQSHKTTRKRGTNTVNPAIQAALKQDDRQQLITQISRVLTKLVQQSITITYPNVLEHLGIPRTDLLGESYSQIRQTIDQLYIEMQLQPVHTQDHEFVARVNTILQDLLQAGQPPYGTTIASILHCHPSMLFNHVAINLRLKQAYQQYTVEEEQRRLTEVQQAIQALSDEGEDVNVTAIVKYLKLPALTSLLYFPSVARLLDEIIKQNRKQAQHERATRPQRMRDAIRQLDEQGQLVTQDAIAQIVGITVGTLKKYPDTSAVFDELKQRKQREFEKQDVRFCQLIHDAISQLQREHKPVQQKTVSEMIGRAPRGLKYYPQTRQLLQKIVEGHYNEHSSST